MNNLKKHFYQTDLSKGIFFILFLFLMSYAKAQEPIGLYSFPSSYLADIEIDAFENKYVLLFSREDSIYGLGELLFTKPVIDASEENDEGFYYLLALNKENQLLYYKYFSASAAYDNSVFPSASFFDIDVRKSTLIILGSFRSDFFYSTDLNLVAAQQDKGVNLITLEYRLNGHLLSYKQFESPTWYDCTRMFIEKNEHTTIIAGRHMDTMHLDHVQLTPYRDNDNDVFLGKLNDAFQTEWATNIGGLGWDSVADIEIDQDNNILILGNYTHSLMLIGGDTTQPSQTNFNGVFIMKFENGGKPIWQKQITGEHVRSNSIALLDDNSFYIVGEYNAPSAHFDEYTINCPTNLFNTYIAKYTQHGELEWVRQLGTDHVSDVFDASVDENGDLWFTGYFVANDKFKIGELEFTEPGGKGDIYIAKYSPTGEALFAMVFGGPEWEVGTHIIPLENGRILFSGRTVSSRVAINNDTIYNSIGGISPFLFEFKDPTSESVELDPKPCGIQFYPNPIFSKNHLHIQQTNCQVNSFSQVTLVNLSGKLIFDKTLQFPFESIYVPNVPAGMYFLEYTSPLGKEVKKLVVL